MELTFPDLLPSPSSQKSFFRKVTTLDGAEAYGKWSLSKPVIIWLYFKIGRREHGSLDYFLIKIN
jgi:hypothetical protein